MTNPTPPVLPFPDDDDSTDDDVATREVDGEETLDPDADPDAVDSAEADRLAAEGGDDDDGR
ncbi:hypothetical protein [Microbacterium sp. XT11]|uniref:hypothetical protein n=1 Tax=Microbacterium sp. XT11 TaxID=367477 RepID=UPI00082AE057|nr:hypothetical protein [Microbacterium sp. XT11]